MLPLLRLDEEVDLVCSADPAVTLLLAPLSDEEKERGAVAQREPRVPTRWLVARTIGPTKAEVDSVGRGACIVTVRLLDDVEQLQCCPNGLVDMGEGDVAAAAARANRLGIVAFQGERLDARTPSEVAAARRRLHMVHWMPLGTWILRHSVLPPDPFDDTGSPSPPTSTSSPS